MEWKNSSFNYLLLTGWIVSLVVLITGILLGFRETVFILCTVSFIIAFTASMLFYNRSGLKAEEQYGIEYDEECITCRHSEKPTETVRWKDIHEIMVITTDKGPYEPYIWILLSTDGGKGCMFPLGARNSRQIIEKILGFRNFYLDKWAEALASDSNKRFVVWTRSDI